MKKIIAILVFAIVLTSCTSQPLQPPAVQQQTEVKAVSFQLPTQTSMVEPWGNYVVVVPQYQGGQDVRVYFGNQLVDSKVVEGNLCDFKPGERLVFNPSERNEVIIWIDRETGERKASLMFREDPNDEYYKEDQIQFMEMYYYITGEGYSKFSCNK